MVLNSRCESFAKTQMFLQAFQKLRQNVQQKIGRGRGILFTVGNVDRDIGRHSGRYSGRQSVDSRSTVGRQSVDSRSIVGR